MASVSELLDRFVDLFNAGRHQEAESDFASNGFGEEVGTGRRFTPQEGTANARAWKEAYLSSRKRQVWRLSRRRWNIDRSILVGSNAEAGCPDYSAP